MKPLLEISLTNACVNACPYCIAKGVRQVPFSKERQAEGGGVYLNPAYLLDFCLEFQKRHPEGAVYALTGGEPMCHPAFECVLDMLNFIKGNNKIALFSNLKLLTGKRAEYINRCADYLIAGYHPQQDTMCMHRRKDDPKNSDDFGHYYHTDLEWLAEKLSAVKIPYNVNYIVGAYTGDVLGNENNGAELAAFSPGDLALDESDELPYQKHLKEFELDALRRKIPYIKTPLNHRVGLKGSCIQMKSAPDMLLVRPDGTIVKCAGDSGAIGSIYNVDYDWGLLCKRNCPLCPSFYPFLGMEHLFCGEA